MKTIISLLFLSIFLTSCGSYSESEKVKFDKTKTFANLRSYKLEMNIAQLKVDTVELTTPYFSTPILGKLYDKTIIELNEGENSPQFNSFEKRLKIPDLNENMEN